jgi:hypothetical protein
VDTQLWQRHIAYLQEFLTRTNYADEAARLRVADRLSLAKKTLDR